MLQHAAVKSRYHAGAVGPRDDGMLVSARAEFFGANYWYPLDGPCLVLGCGAGSFLSIVRRGIQDARRAGILRSRVLVGIVIVPVVFSCTSSRSGTSPLPSGSELRTSVSNPISVSPSPSKSGSPPVSASPSASVSEVPVSHPVEGRNHPHRHRGRCRPGQRTPPFAGRRFFCGCIRSGTGKATVGARARISGARDAFEYLQRMRLSARTWGAEQCNGAERKHVVCQSPPEALRIGGMCV